jgi:hypothetical protein
MYGTKGYTESTPSKKYIQPGLNENVTLVSITGNAPEGRAPYLELTFRLATGGETDTTAIRLYMSENAKKRATEALIHLATKVVTRDEIDAVTGTTIEDYASGVNKLLKGETWGVLKFKGQEYTNSNGETKYKATLGFAPFAEATTSTLETTKLTFDPNNKWDFERLEAPSLKEHLTAVVNDDLPF